MSLLSSKASPPRGSWIPPLTPTQTLLFCTCPLSVHHHEVFSLYGIAGAVHQHAVNHPALSSHLTILYPPPATAHSLLLFAEKCLGRVIYTQLPPLFPSLCQSCPWESHQCPPSLICPIVLCQVPPPAALKHPWHRRSLLPSQEFLVLASGPITALRSLLPPWLVLLRRPCWFLLLLNCKHANPGLRLLLSLSLLLWILGQHHGIRHRLFNL